MREFMSITRALADAHRVRMLLALRGTELCVCQVTELLSLAPSTVSKHLSILHQAGLVESRREGRWMHYRLPGRDASAPVRRAVQWVFESVQEERQVGADATRLEKIRAMDPALLCKRQSRK